MNRMAALLTLCTFVLPALVHPLAAVAGATITVSADDAGELVQFYDTPVGAPFELVVWLDTDGHTASAAEFVMTELTQLVPGVLKLSVSRINAPTVDLGDNSRGEYLFPFGPTEDHCVEPSAQLEIVRVEYLDNTGAIGRGVIVSLRGLQPGDTVPSSFDGEPGFATCDQSLYRCDGGTPGGFTVSGGRFPDGATVLNPRVGIVSGPSTSLSTVKARY